MPSGDRWLYIQMGLISLICLRENPENCGMPTNANNVIIYSQRDDEGNIYNTDIKHAKQYIYI